MQNVIQIAHRLLLVMFLLFTFVGTRPLSGSSDATDPLNAPVALLMLIIGLPIIWAFRQEALHCVRYNALLIFVVIFSFSSVFWSDFPDLTIKRSVLFLCLATAALAIAAGVRDFRRFHTTVFLVLTFVIICNLVFYLTDPVTAVDELGVRGIYGTKNVAGLVAMIAVITGTCWLAGAATMRSMVLGCLAIGFASLLLIISNSKTALALTLIVLSIYGIVLFVSSRRSSVALGLFGITLVTLAAAILGMASIDFEINTLLKIATGDPTLTGRDELWAFALEKAMERPLLGHGYGAFWDVGEEHDPLAKLEPGTWLGDVRFGLINQAHNGYIELALHVGFPVMVIGVLSVLRRTASSLRSGPEADSHYEHVVMYGVIGSVLLVYLLHNITEGSLFIRGQILCNFAILAAFVETRRWFVERNETPPELVTGGKGIRRL